MHLGLQGCEHTWIANGSFLSVLGPGQGLVALGIPLSWQVQLTLVVSEGRFFPDGTMALLWQDLKSSG